MFDYREFALGALFLLYSCFASLIQLMHLIASVAIVALEGRAKTYTCIVHCSCIVAPLLLPQPCLNGLQSLLDCLTLSR